MLKDGNDLDEKELLHWIRRSVETNANIFSRGYQGCVYLYKGEDGRRLIIKAPIGWGLGRLIRRMMLRNEFAAYSRLPHLEGIPRCLGLIGGSYLVLEFIDGIPVRTAEITDRRFFFEAFLSLIKQLHIAGVAHTDLKKKDNILVVQGREPCIIDFGVAVIEKKGFAPLNRFLYNTAKQFDFNAWVKLKYNGKYEDLSEEDSLYFNRTLIEKGSRWIKDTYLIVKKAFVGGRRKSR